MNTAKAQVAADRMVTPEEFFRDSDSEQLQKVYALARARYASPWGVFFAVLVRVAASVPPYVQLPPVIYGRASLNLMCAFVGNASGGKGGSTKVAAEAWPTDICTLPPASGQGIAETFTKRDNGPEPVPIIFDVPEVDTLKALTSNRESTLLATLKSVAMGEQLGGAGATAATRRNVPAHSYRACLSVGVQPGHASVIFADTSGGTPQRFLFAPATDPSIPDGEFSALGPLVTAQPDWQREPDGVVEIRYGVPKIAETIRTEHIARQRGEGDALDGHALLTRCKVAAVLAIMHQRQTVTAEDWERSGIVMAVSNRTREALIDKENAAVVERSRSAGRMRAAQREGYDQARVQSVADKIVHKLQAGDLAGSDLRKSLNSGVRYLFEDAIGKLADDGLIVATPSGTGTSYKLAHPPRVATPATLDNSRSNGVAALATGGGEPQGITTEKRSSGQSAGKRPSARAWLKAHLAELKARGVTSVERSAVMESMLKDGYSDAQYREAQHHLGYVGQRWALTDRGKPAA